MAIVATHVAAVQELYVAYFGRPADVAGLDYWTNVVEAQGGSTAAVSASFATQPEYVVAFYQKTNAQIVDQIYANMFARAGSTTDGRAYWVDLLNKGTVGISTIVAEVAKGAQGADAEAVENKVAAATAFTNALDTSAEQAGYSGASALALAKAFITGVTTDATLTTAIAPANLNAQVAAVVKAGTPFTVNSGLAALDAANDNLADFLEENELTEAGASAALSGDVTTTTNALDLLVTGDYAAAASGVKTALLTEQQRLNNAELTKANGDLVKANADAAAVSGLSAAIANLRAATAEDKAATEAAAATEVELQVAKASFETRLSVTTDIVLPAANAPAATPVVTWDDAGTDKPLIVTNARGNLVLATGVTEKDYPGITALRDALIADIDADVEAGLASDALDDAEGEALITGNTAAVNAVLDAYTAIETAQGKIEALAEAVADRTEAVAVKAEYDALVKAIADGKQAFVDAGYAEPVPLNGAAAATSGSDIFMAGTADATISSFGRSGEDSLFVGSQFKLNEGTLKDGDNAAMEVFFVQNGSRTEVHVEQAAYGSDSDDVTVITLIGVNADDLQLVDGIISLKGAAA